MGIGNKGEENQQKKDVREREREREREKRRKGILKIKYTHIYLSLDMFRMLCALETTRLQNLANWYYLYSPDAWREVLKQTSFTRYII